MAEVKKGGKAIVIIVVLIGLFFLVKYMQGRPKEVAKIAEVGKIVIPDQPDAPLKGAAATKIAFPGTAPALNGGVHITVPEMAWQAQSALNYANGGERTTKGSLFDQAKLDVQIVRRDDCSQSVTEYIKSVNDYQSGASKDGYFPIYMGSGIPNYIHQMTEGTKALGPQFAPIVFCAVGRSYGEDQMIGDKSFKDNPQLLKGKVCVGVMLDGDQDVVIKFCYDNGIKVNPDATLWYPDRLNLAYPKDFLDAVVKYNDVTLREKRHIVINGKTTGKDTLVGYDACATWTPGDKNAADGRGGATIISTRTYGAIMPAVVIGCKKFLNDNREAVENFIDAIAQAGDQIKSYQDVQKYATSLNGQIWNEPGFAWNKLFTGYQSGDMHLGGSGVFNLADMSAEFGLSGTSDVYKEVYTTFGKIQTALYPKDFPTFVPYSSAVDKSFMLSLIANPREHVAGTTQKVDYSQNMTEKVASRAVHINFETGSARIDDSSIPTLDDIYSSTTTAEGLKVGVYGYTDNTGNPDANITLSDQRAAAVASYLQRKGLNPERVVSKGYGQANPVAPNSTKEGKAANRRVEIVLLGKADN
jgi:OmpA-OmpF porin, OOP family